MAKKRARSASKQLDSRQLEFLQAALCATVDAGQSDRDERRLAFIEAALREALGEDHGVWGWRLAFKRAPKSAAEALAKDFSPVLR